MLLFLGVTSLLLGALAAVLLEKSLPSKWLVKGFNSAIFLMVIFLILWHIVPEILSLKDFVAPVLFVAGIGLPWFSEKVLRKAADKAHMATLLLASCGLVFHAFVDGAALNDEMTMYDQGWLAWAVILHRLPVGYSLWILLRDAFSARLALAMLVIMSLATATGHFAEPAMLRLIDAPAYLYIQALLSGTLLHVVLHQPHQHEHSH